MPRGIDHFLQSDHLSLDQSLIGTAVDFVERSTGFLRFTFVQEVEWRVWKKWIAGQQDDAEGELQDDHDLVGPLIGSLCTKVGSQCEKELPKDNRSVDDTEKSSSDLGPAHFSDENRRDQEDNTKPDGCKLESALNNGDLGAR